MWTSPRLLPAVATVLVLAGLGDLARPGPAGALELSVSPVRMQLAPTQKSAMLRVGNPNTEPITVQVKVFAWSQNADGLDQLEPTSDLLVFPQMVTIKPGAERNIRVGTMQPRRDVEVVFRLLLEPLITPKAAAAVDEARGNRSAQTTIITRTSLPVFVLPAKGLPAPLRVAGSVAGGKLLLRITNPGTVHALPPAVTMKGYSAGEELLLDGESRGWYVLAGATRIETIALPADACVRLRRLVVDLRNGQQAETLTVPVTPDQCSS